MMNPGCLSTSIFGTREHDGTPKSYLPIYKTHFLYTLIFRHKKYMKMGFLVFHVFQVLKIRRFLEQMKEADIVKAIMKYLKTVPGCFCWKEHGGMYGTAGIPDIIACINGHFYGFEVKTESGKPTKLQEATIRKILAAGGTALVVRSVDEVRTVVNGSLH